MGNSSDSKHKFTPKWRTVALLLLTIVILQICAGFAVYFSLGSWTERGSFGDMFGAVNALFSGLALAGVVYAILLQSRELALQREELFMSREELRRTADAQQAANQLQIEQLEMIKKRHAVEEGERAKEVAPALEIIDVTESPENIMVRVLNRGGSMTKARVTEAPPGAKVRIEPAGGILRESNGSLVITIIDDTHRSLQFTIKYNDEHGANRSLKIDCDPWRKQLTCEALPEDDCYLTSACVAHAGLPDDCLELSTMRAFRDDFLMTTVPGVSLVSRYYRHAPSLLTAIRSSPTCDKIMEWILQQVRKTSDHFEAGRKSEALETYLDMIIALETEFRVSTGPDTGSEIH